MITFLKSLFGASIPSTRKYEAQLNEVEQAYARSYELANAPEYKRYLELKDFTSSPSFMRKLNGIKRLTFKGSPEWSIEQRYKRLRKNRDVKKYFKSKDSADSSTVAEFISVEKQLASVEFIQRKQYLSNKNRHKLSEEYMLLEEYQRLSKSNLVAEYAKLKKRYKVEFEERNSWDISFQEDFTQSLFGKQWSTTPFWSETFLKQPYSQSNEKQLPTDGRNLEAQIGLLSIITRKEQANGLAWDNKLGFIPKTFSYTSGTLNTSGIFRQQYGRFVAKVKMSQSKNIYHAFWMGSEKMLPHITVFKAENKKVLAGIYVEDNRSEKQLGFKLNEDFYIFELLWNQIGVSWFINGKKVYSSLVNTDMPLYLAFSSGVTDDIPDHRLPQCLSIEWIKCYSKK